LAASRAAAGVAAGLRPAVEPVRPARRRKRREGTTPREPLPDTANPRGLIRAAGRPPLRIRPSPGGVPLAADHRRQGKNRCKIALALVLAVA